MRVIKFRGKSLETDDWVYGYLADGNLICTWNDIINAQEVLSTTVGQFTGLHDKNGKEVYEDDIISSKKHPQIKHLIFYNEEQGKFMAGLYGNTNIYDFGVCGVDNPSWMAEKEVVGDIHDNPELLKGGQDD